MLAVTEITSRREAPATVLSYGSGADRIAIIKDGDSGTCFTGTVERRTRIVC